MPFHGGVAVRLPASYHRPRREAIPRCKFLVDSAAAVC